MKLSGFVNCKHSELLRYEQDIIIKRISNFKWIFHVKIDRHKVYEFTCSTHIFDDINFTGYVNVDRYFPKKQVFSWYHVCYVTWDVWGQLFWSLYGNTSSRNSNNMSMSV